MSDIESPPAMDNMSLASEDCWLGEVPTEARHHTPTSDSMDDMDGSVLSKPMILAAIQSPSLPPPSPLPLRTTTTSTSSTATILTSLREEERRKRLEARKNECISVKVGLPHRVAKGMLSYMAYTVTTTTNLHYFKDKNPTVNRRFSDFLGLRDKLVTKYLHHGRIIPPAPDKSVLGMARVKMAKDEEEDAEHAEFVEKRRAALERFLSRTANHPQLRTDPDFTEFLELDAVLPMANQTSTLSGKNVLRIINKVTEYVSGAYTARMEETDVWFEEKTALVENLDSHLKKLQYITEAITQNRKRLAQHTVAFSKSLTMLADVENNQEMAQALGKLSEVENEVGKFQELQAKSDFYLLSELVRDYIGIVGSVREVLGERVKAWQAWNAGQRNLDRKREAMGKAEQDGKMLKVNALRQEIAENEREVTAAQNNFEKISRIIKSEFEAYDVKKCLEFKQTVVTYTQQMHHSQKNIAAVWANIRQEMEVIKP